MHSSVRFSFNSVLLFGLAFIMVFFFVVSFHAAEKATPAPVEPLAQSETPSVDSRTWSDGNEPFHLFSLSDVSSLVIRSYCHQNGVCYRR